MNLRRLIIRSPVRGDIQHLWHRAFQEYRDNDRLPLKTRIAAL
jgi:hypothetical protein